MDLFPSKECKTKETAAAVTKEGNAAPVVIVVVSRIMPTIRL